MSDVAAEAPTTRAAIRGRWVGRFLFHVIWRGRVVDRHKLPDGPVLLASNHSGFLDGPLVFGLAPRPSHFLVKAEMFHGFLGWVLRWAGQIPIDRTGSDRRALQLALAVLKRGDVVGVFPEGSRGAGDVAAVHAGITWLALQSGAPIVPVATLGTRRPGERERIQLPLHRLVVVYGDPVVLEAAPGVPRREAIRTQTERLRQVLADHVIASSARTGIPLHGETVPRTPAGDTP